MNSLRHGYYSPAFVNLVWAVNTAPPCAVDETIRAALAPEQAAHPVSARFVEVARQAEVEVAAEAVEQRARLGKHKVIFGLSEAWMLLKNQGDNSDSLWISQKTKASSE